MAMHTPATTGTLHVKSQSTPCHAGPWPPAGPPASASPGTRPCRPCPCLPCPATQPPAPSRRSVVRHPAPGGLRVGVVPPGCAPLAPRSMAVVGVEEEKPRASSSRWLAVER